MEVTAIISADPVDVTAIRIMIRMRNSPAFPRRVCATTGATRPVNTCTTRMKAIYLSMEQYNEGHPLKSYFNQDNYLDSDIFCA